MVYLNRRTFLAGTGATALGLTFARPAYSQAGSDTIRLGVGAAQVVTIDPIHLAQGVDNWAITNVHDLLARAPNGRFANTPAEFMPELAETWESSPDGKTWSFKLRQGAQFHKGYGEASSEDVKFTFDRARDPQTGSIYASVFRNIEEVVTEGPYTVHFHLKTPDPFFLASSVDHIGAHIVSKKAVEEKGDGYGRDPIGTGPYMVESVQPKVVTLVGNDAYYTGAPIVPKLEIQYLLNSSARTLALLGGSVDTILAPSGPGAIPAIQQRDPSLILDTVLPGNIWTLHFNLQRKPFDDLKVRQAFMYAIDREAIAASQTPPTLHRYGMLPAPFPGSLTADTCPPELRYEHDPDKAKQLLTEAGVGDGFSFSDFTSQRDDYLSLMLVVQEQLRQVGVNFDLQPIDHAAFHDQSAKGLASFRMRGTLYPPVPIRPFIEELASSADVTGPSGGQNFAHYGTAMPGIDDLIAKAQAEPDFDKHLAICQEMDRKILTDLPVIPLCTTAYVYIRNPRLKLPFEVSAGTGFWRFDKASFA